MTEVLRFKGEGGVRAPYSGLCPEAGGQGVGSPCPQGGPSTPTSHAEQVFPYLHAYPTPPSGDSLEEKCLSAGESQTETFTNEPRTQLIALLPL